MSLRTVLTLAALSLSLNSRAALAQQVPNPYGAPIGTEAAKKIAGAALGEARRQNLTEAVAIVDGAGDLVYFEKIDGTQAASVDLAIDKGRSAARYKRSTKFFLDNVTQGGAGMRFLGMRGAVPTDGGLPIVMDGKVVGAIGVSGGTGEQDGQCAAAGVAAVK